ncbi:LacI family DNA-binding transcriptional regulator [Georgenia sp. SYP-B2076]|uniref:LacI family DNA-binding transcriptional regulator n=1 Tax=Georgenia sp. SYP-B2076 TaxID=2495881 RepID=UPI003518800A
MDAPAREDFIALIVPELGNPFYASLAEACTTLAAEAGVSVVVAVSGRRHRRESTLSAQLTAASNVGGLIYAGMNRTNDELQRAVADGFPVVVLDEEIDLGPDATVPTVTVDNYGGAYQATSYLATMGHRRIAHVSGPPALLTSQERLRGYRDALAAHGLEVDEDLVLHGPYTEQYGASVLPYLTRGTAAPTAVFVGSDIVAVGILSAAELHGLRIPEDLSVVGCDGIQLGQWLRPQLTTLAQPIHELARTALDTLRTAAEGPQEPVRTVLPLQLVVRGSVAAPRPGATH